MACANQRLSPGTGARAKTITLAEETAHEFEPPIRKARSAQESNQGFGAGIELYVREIGQLKSLTPREEEQLLLRARKGDRQARENLIKAGLRRVVKVARQFHNSGLPLLDLVSEGNVGLLQAIDQFAPAKGSKFSTYSARCIKDSIDRAIAALS